MESLLLSTDSGSFLQLQHLPSFPTLSKRTLSTLKLIRNNAHNLSNPNISSFSVAKPNPNSIPQKIPTQYHKKTSFEASQKVAYLESIGVDSYSALAANSAISTTSLSSIQTVVNFLYRMGILQEDLGKLFSVCPQLLTVSVSEQLRPVFTFLLREAKIPPRHLRQVICRRPRLLALSVKDRLRPTLYFLQRHGFTQVSKFSFLLPCSVELKLLPKMEYFHGWGIEYDDVVNMFWRFPALFNYSVEDNFKPKFEYLVNDMGRNVSELKPFPQYFAFSLEKRIKPRHRILVENGVHGISLGAMLRPGDSAFFQRLKKLDFGVDSNVDESEWEGLYSRVYSSSCERTWSSFEHIDSL